MNGNDGKNTFSHTGTDKNYYCGVIVIQIVIQITTPKIVFHIYFVVTGVKRSAVLKTFYLTLFTRVSVLHAMLWTSQLLERSDRGFMLIIAAIRQTTTPGVLGFPDLIWLPLPTLGYCQLAELRVVVWSQLLPATLQTSRKYPTAGG